MARAKQITITGTGSGATYTNPYILDAGQDPFEIGLMLETDGNTTTATVQHTLDPNPSASSSWFTVSGFSALTAGAIGSLSIPSTAIRLAAGATGTDTLTLTILQPVGR